MDSYFFRVDHDLMRSDSFKSLGGSAIKVYLVIGMYSDFGTGWAYPSIRTIARQAGLSRQTVLTALEELADAGLVASQKSSGKSNAYQILRQAPLRPKATRTDRSGSQQPTVQDSLVGLAPSGPNNLDLEGQDVPNSLEDVAQFFGPRGRGVGPKRETANEKDDNTSVAIPGTPFRLSADGRLLVAVDLQKLLTGEGLPKRMAERIVAQKDPEAVAKVLLNALYLKSQGKLQNGPGYIRAGIEEGYDLLPQVANRLESRRRELEAQQQRVAGRRSRQNEQQEVLEEQMAIQMLIESLDGQALELLVQKAVAALPGPLVRHNPTLSNPFIRAKVYELAGGEPVE